jgi:hypothetical protein
MVQLPGGMISTDVVVGGYCLAMLHSVSSVKCQNT